MKGYAARKGDRWYAVTYEGLDPVTGRELDPENRAAWSAEELQAFLRAAAGHQLFPALWVAAFTGMRRNELLGLRWADFDAAKATLSINRGLVAIGYELH